MPHQACFAAVLLLSLALQSACSIEDVVFKRGDEIEIDAAPLAERCDAVGDEDGNGAADCMDPVCAQLPACQPPPPQTCFDVAFVDELIIQPTTFGIGSFAVVINRGSKPLDLATAQIVRFSDNNAEVGWNMSIRTVDFQLQPGRAAGGLSPAASQKLIDSGLVSETRDTQMLVFGMEANNVPRTTFDLRGEATLRIGDKELVLPVITHFVTGAATELSHVRRFGGTDCAARP